MDSKSEPRFARPSITLPPGLHGPNRGEVLLLFRWTGAARASPSMPVSQTAHVVWWGETSSGTSVQLAPRAERGLIYTVTCGPKAFARYLADMQQLKVSIELELGHTKHTAQAKVALNQLQTDSQVTHRIPVTTAEGCLLGTAALAISLSHTPLISSFEVNEHLASTDFTMPLYPATSRLVTPLRQLNIQSHSRAQPESLGRNVVSATPACLDSPAFKHSIPPSMTGPAKQPQAHHPKLSSALLDLSR